MFQIEENYNVNFNRKHSLTLSSSESETIQIEDLQLELSKPSPRQPAGYPYPPSPDDIARYREENHKVILNIGGTKFEVMWKSFEPRILSRLGKLYRAKTHEKILSLVDMYNLEDNEFYFDRDPGSFNCILNYHRTGKLHCIDEVCPLDYTDDLKFWNIDENFLESCCQVRSITFAGNVRINLVRTN